jgi:hypothetical protein
MTSLAPRRESFSILSRSLPGDHPNVMQVQQFIEKSVEMLA